MGGIREDTRDAEGAGLLLLQGTDLDPARLLVLCSLFFHLSTVQDTFLFFKGKFQLQRNESANIDHNSPGGM